MTNSCGKFIWKLLLVQLVVGISLVSIENAAARCDRNSVEKVEAINNAEWIVIAKMQDIRTSSAENQQGKTDRFVNLDVVEYIKGNGPSVISVRSTSDAAARYDSKRPVDANYYGHRATSFWSLGGRTRRSPDCAWSPSFSDGGNLYLVFGPNGHYSGYENVTEDDRWVEYVRDVVANSDEAIAPFPISEEEYFRQVAAVVRLTATWSDDGPILKTEILKGPELPYFEMLYVSPMRSMNGSLDPACSVRRVAPGEMNSIDFLAIFDFLPEEKVTTNSLYGCLIKTGLRVDRAEGLFSVHGHKRYNISGEKVTFGRRSPIIAKDGQVISIMKLVDIKGAIQSD